MAEETKEQATQCGCGSSKILGTAFKVILGLALIVAGALLGLRWRWAIKVILEGGIPFALILAGIIALAIAKE